MDNYQSSKSRINWSPEMYQLKLIMEKKLKCQNGRHHRVTKGRWQVDVTNYNKRGDVHQEANWKDCEVCNK